MKPYPSVLSEFDTLAAVVAGKSLARYGDGEFNLCAGIGLKFQTWSADLQQRLLGILRDSGDCLVGIPNILSNTPKQAFWYKYRTRASWLSDRPYGSAFVSRPDSAPWINTPAYWALMESLWVGREVTLVRGRANSLTAADLLGARVTEVMAPPIDAWQDYDALLDRIGTPERALLCLGPTATVLAVDLCAKGVHAIDLGHVGMFLRKHRRGEPMIRTEQDKVA